MRNRSAQHVEARHDFLDCTWAFENSSEDVPVRCDDNRQLTKRGVVDGAIRSRGYAVINLSLFEVCHILLNVSANFSVPPAWSSRVFQRFSDDFADCLFKAVKQFVLFCHPGCFFPHFLFELRVVFRCALTRHTWDMPKL